MNDDAGTLQGAQQGDLAQTHDEESDCPAGVGSTKAGLPWGFVAFAAAGTFLFLNKEAVMTDGGFIYGIGALVLGVMLANMMAGK